MSNGVGTKWRDGSIPVFSPCELQPWLCLLLAWALGTDALKNQVSVGPGPGFYEEVHEKEKVSNARAFSTQITETTTGACRFEPGSSSKGMQVQRCSREPI